MVALEASKTSDYFKVEFGFDLDDLVLNIDKQKLCENKKLSGFIKMFEM